MKERIVIDEDFYVKHFQEREIEFQEEDMCSGGNPEEWWHYKKEQVPETMAELGKIASDLAIEKRCAMRYMDESDGSFFIVKDSELYLFKETREITVSRLYHKLIWLLGE